MLKFRTKFRDEPSPGTRVRQEKKNRNTTRKSEVRCVHVARVPSGARVAKKQREPSRTRGRPLATLQKRLNRRDGLRRGFAVLYLTEFGEVSRTRHAGPACRGGGSSGRGRQYTFAVLPILNIALAVAIENLRLNITRLPLPSYRCENHRSAAVRRLAPPPFSTPTDFRRRLLIIIILYNNIADRFFD